MRRINKRHNRDKESQKFPPAKKQNRTVRFPPAKDAPHCKALRLQLSTPIPPATLAPLPSNKFISPLHPPLYKLQGEQVVHSCGSYAISPSLGAFVVVVDVQHIRWAGLFVWFVGHKRVLGAYRVLSCLVHLCLVCSSGRRVEYDTDAKCLVWFHVDA